MAHSIPPDEAKPAGGYSLSSRLWLVLVIALLPLLALTVLDYRRERQAAIADIEHEARLMLQSAYVEEAAALRQARQILRIMGLADNMRELDPADCRGLAERLATASEDIANIGAALPNGEIICSARPTSGRVNVADRAWFKESLSNNDVSNGQFTMGKISGRPGITFGRALRDDAGKLRAVLFVASDFAWFDRLTANYRLPEDWSSLLFAADGLILSRYPQPEKWRNSQPTADSRARLLAALNSASSTVVMPDVDGVERLFVLHRLKIASGDLVVAVGAPVARTLAGIENAFRLRLLLLAGIALLSFLLSRYYLHNLIERWIARLRDATSRVSAGDFTARLGDARSPREMNELDQRFNAMSSALEQREAQYLADREAIERLNHTLEERLAALEAAEQDLRRLSTAVEQSPTSIVITDTEPKIVYVNHAFSRTSGYRADEVLGRNPRILQSGDTPPETYRSMWQALSAGQVWRGEFSNRHRDGSHYLELATISPVRGNDGRIAQYVAVKEDITERRRIEDELTAHRQRLEELVDRRTGELAVAKAAAEAANRAKSAFLANMSHEIRTPMNAIIGLNYLLLQGDVDDEQRDKLRKISSAAEHLLRVINDILDLSKIEAGKIILDRQVFSPAELLRDVAGVIRDQALGKGLEVSVSSGDLPPYLLGDATRLRQVLLNFAGNALKFTAHGSIRLAGQLVGGAEAGPVCRFSVTDTGIGIPAADIARLFMPFEQLDASSTRRFGGTGLGLTIARHLAELMGGEVGVDSQPGQGSTFWISARLEATSRPAPPARPAGLQQPTARPGGRRILFVEDEAVNREIGRDLLEAGGLEVATANNGEEAVERFREGLFDLILMDIQMPRLDGIQATRRIRALPGGEAVPIIALTANAFVEDRERCLAAGMNDFLAKPVAPDRLYAALANYLAIDLSVFAATTAEQAPEPLDGAALRSGLETLHQHLKSGNVEAGVAFARLQHALEAASPAEFASLRRHVEAFDYEAALPLVQAWLERIS